MSDKLWKRIDTVFLPVRDLDKAVEWYTSLFSLPLRWRVEGYACLDIGETPLTLYEVKTPLPVLDHPLFNFYSAEIDLAYRKLTEAGVEVTELETDGGLRHFRFRDSDGNPLEVCWWDESKQSQE